MLLGILGVVISLIWLFPVYWMVNSSLLSNVVLQNTTPQFLPFGGNLDNFTAVFSGGTFVPALGMSLAIALLTVVFCLIFAFLAALAISRFKFRGRTSFVLAVLLIQMLPAEGLFIAQYKMMSSLNLLNTIVGVSILYIAAVVPFTIWMLRGFVAGIPADLEEAAMVDGLSRTQAFMRITFPLLAPGLVASGVYAFLQAWNEFTVALVILPDNAEPDPPALVARVHPAELQPRDRLGPGHGRVHSRRRAGHHLLPVRAGPHDQRTRQRGGEGVTGPSVAELIQTPDSPEGEDRLRRQVAATLLPGFVGTTLPEWLAERLRDGLGGVCIFGPNIVSRAQLRALTDSIYEANPNAIVAIDEEGGDVTRLYYDTGSPYPGNAVLGRLGDLSYTEFVGRLVGWELRLAGCNLNFAPDVDINSNADNPVIGVRSFGSTPEVVAEHSAAWTRGLQSAGIAVSAKHFPGHGDTAQDSHLALPVVDLTLDELRERELKPFAAVIAAGARTIMTSHILLPQIDPEQPCNAERAGTPGTAARRTRVRRGDRERRTRHEGRQRRCRDSRSRRPRPRRRLRPAVHRNREHG